jgi:endoglucanase
MKDLWIDIGASDKKEAEKLVSVGDPIAFKPNYSALRNNRIVSKGLDDKIGAFIAAETVKTITSAKFKDIAVYCVGTVQEEVGLRGAQPAAFSIQPNVGFAIDVGFATDTPDINVKQYGVAKLGKGPILHRNADNNAILGKLMRAIAKKNKINYQEDAGHRASGGTDTAVIQLTKSGVATALISIPSRYMHTQVEMVDLKDVENAVKLLSQTIMSLKSDQSFLPL